MPEGLKKILIASSADSREAVKSGFTVAHLAYRISGDMHLLRSGVAVTARGGYMALSDQTLKNMTGSASEFCKELFSECTKREYEGVIADFEQTQDARLIEIIKEAGEMLSKRNITLFVNEEYAAVSQNTNILIQTSISGGSLPQRLRDATEKYGAARISLDIERMRNDFNLAEPSNKSRHMEREELSELLSSSSALVFFSRELCAHYFTYKDESGQSHFVLFDDANSIKRKMEFGEKLGIKRAFLLYPEVSDILSELTEHG